MSRDDGSLSGLFNRREEDIDDMPLNLTLSGHAHAPSAMVMLPGDPLSVDEAFPVDFDFHTPAEAEPPTPGRAPPARASCLSAACSSDA